MAGDYRVARILGDRSTGLSVSVQAPADKVTVCVVPILGRDVHGHIALPKEVDAQRYWAWAAIVQRSVFPQIALPADVLQMTPAERLAWYNRWEAQTAEGQALVAQRKTTKENRSRRVLVASDGSFVAADLPDGAYVVCALFFPSSGDFKHQLATAAYDVSLPVGERGPRIEPLDVGTLRPRVLETINAGLTAPDIAFRTAEGSDLLLSGFRGKVVLLDFWGTWCGNCVADLPNVKAIFDTYGSNPHFAMVSLSVGDDEATWQKFVKANQMRWTQTLLGQRDEAWQAKLFCVPGYPHYWLIGPDGKVLADGFQSKPLRPILDKALGALK